MFTYLKLFLIFFKIGLFGFGGGYAMLPMIYNDIQTFNLMSAKDFADIVAISQITPGPIAINTATFVGFQMAGLPGSIIATAGVMIPSVILILIISSFFYKFKTSLIVESIMKTIRPVTIGLIFAAGFMLFVTSVLAQNITGNTLFTNPLSLISIPALIIFGITAFLLAKFDTNPIILTIAAGLVGALII